MVTPAQISQLSTPQPGVSQGNPSIQASTFAFIAGWTLLIVILMMANKTRLGHVIIYYCLLLLIIFIIVTEYQQIAPLLNSVETVGQLNQ